MASKLYIGGLSYSTTSDGLREFFSQSGNVLSATVITDRFSGQSRGFGFVEMNTAEDAQNAISQLNGRELDGRRITVEISNPQAPRTGGGGGGGRPGWRSAGRRPAGWRAPGRRRWRAREWLRASAVQAGEVVASGSIEDARNRGASREAGPFCFLATRRR